QCPADGVRHRAPRAPAPPDDDPRREPGGGARGLRDPPLPIRADGEPRAGHPPAGGRHPRHRHRRQHRRAVLLRAPEPASRPAPRRTLTLGLIALFGGNMLSQAALMLIQSDWLPGGAILWDSSALLPEDSLAGQLFYALVGYEATPSLTQAIAYFGGFTLLAGLAVAATRRGDNPFTQDHRP